MVVRLSSTIGGNLQKNDIKDIYRVRGKKEQQNLPIVVETSSAVVKSDILRLSKAINVKTKGKLCAKHLGFRTSEDTPVFISEQLTAKGARLHYLARDLAKSAEYKLCWTAYSKVYVRKTETSQIICIKSEEQVHQLLLKKWLFCESVTLIDPCKQWLMGNQNVTVPKQFCMLITDCLHDFSYEYPLHASSLAYLLMFDSKVTVQTWYNLCFDLMMICFSLLLKRKMFIHQIITYTHIFTNSHTHIHLHKYIYTPTLILSYIEVQNIYMVFTELSRAEFVLKLSPI